MKKETTSQQASRVLTRHICLSLCARHPDTACAVQHHAGCHGVWSSSHSAEGAEGQHFGMFTYTVIGTESLKLLHLSFSRVHRLYPQASRFLNYTLSVEPECQWPPHLCTSHRVGPLPGSPRSGLLPSLVSIPKSVTAE